MVRYLYVPLCRGKGKGWLGGKVLFYCYFLCLACVVPGVGGYLEVPTYLRDNSTKVGNLQLSININTNTNTNNNYLMPTPDAHTHPRLVPKQKGVTPSTSCLPVGANDEWMRSNLALLLTVSS